MLHHKHLTYTATLYPFTKLSLITVSQQQITYLVFAIDLIMVATSLETSNCLTSNEPPFSEHSPHNLSHLNITTKTIMRQTKQILLFKTQPWL